MMITVSSLLTLRSPACGPFTTLSMKTPFPQAFFHVFPSRLKAKMITYFHEYKEQSVFYPNMVTSEVGYKLVCNHLEGYSRNKVPGIKSWCII